MLGPMFLDGLTAFSHYLHFLKEFVGSEARRQNNDISWDKAFIGFDTVRDNFTDFIIGQSEVLMMQG